MDDFAENCASGPPSESAHYIREFAAINSITGVFVFFEFQWETREVGKQTLTEASGHP